MMMNMGMWVWVVVVVCVKRGSGACRRRDLWCLETDCRRLLVIMVMVVIEMTKSNLSVSGSKGEGGNKSTD